MKQLNRNKICMLADQALMSGYNLLLGVFLARLLGIEAYGILTMAWMCILFCSSIQQQFIISPMQIFGAGLGKEESKRFYGQLFYQQLMFAFLCFWGVRVFLEAMPAFFGSFPSELCWSLPSYALLFLISDYLRKQRISRFQSHYALAFDLLLTLTISLLMGYVWLNPELQTLPIVLKYIAYGYAPAIVIGILMHDCLTDDFPYILSEIKRNWSFSKWLLGTALLQWFSGNWFLVTAASLLGPAALGGIRMAQQVVGVLHIPFLVLENYLPSKAAAHYREGNLKGVWTYLSSIFQFGALGMLAMLIAVVFASEFIILHLFGPDYLPYQYVVHGFAFLYLFVYSGIIIRIGLKVIRRTRYVFMAYVVNLIFALPTAHALVEGWGVSGVMMGLVGSQLLMHAVLMWPVLKSWFSLPKLEEASLKE